MKESKKRHRFEFAAKNIFAKAQLEILVVDNYTPYSIKKGEVIVKIKTLNMIVICQRKY